MAVSSLRVWMLLVALIGVVACSFLTGVEGFHLRYTTDRTSYGAGESVVVTLTNLGTEPVWYDSGTAFVRWEAGRRKGLVEYVGVPSFVPVSYELDPEESVVDSFAVAALNGGEPGEYRLLVRARTHWGDRAWIPTTPFRIRD